MITVASRCGGSRTTSPTDGRRLKTSAHQQFRKLSRPAAFYGGYALMAIPAAIFIKRFSYKKGR
jgi:hypothetical protein